MEWESSKFRRNPLLAVREYFWRFDFPGKWIFRRISDERNDSVGIPSEYLEKCECPSYDAGNMFYPSEIHRNFPTDFRRIEHIPCMISDWLVRGLSDIRRDNPTDFRRLKICGFNIYFDDKYY